MPAAVVTVVLCDRREAVALTWKVAVIVVALTTTALLTDTAVPCTVTVAPAVKFAPVRVTVTVAPRAAEFGESEARAGLADTGAVTVNDWDALVPAVVVMVTLRVPVAAAAAMAKVAVMVVELTTARLVADTPAPEMATAAPGWKLAPVSVTATLEPCVPLLGAIELRTGAVGGAVTVTVAAPVAEGDAALAACTVTGPDGGTAGAV